jgi:hypothetical protein
LYVGVSVEARAAVKFQVSAAFSPDPVGMVRTTRKQRLPTSQRRTLKAQRGGAAFQSFTNTERQRHWETALTALNAKHAEADFLFLLTDDWMGQDTAVQNWIKALEWQDELFVAAVEAMYAAMEIPDINEEAILANIPATAAAASALLAYLDDVHRLLTFKLIPWNTKNNKWNRGKNLLNNEKSKLTDFLLYPYRTTNSLIRGICDAFLFMKQNPMLIQTQPELVATRFESFAQQTAYTMTADQIWDGLDMDQNMTDEDRKTLWLHLTKTPAATIDTLPTLYRSRNETIQGKSVSPAVASTIYGAQLVYNLYSTASTVAEAKAAFLTLATAIPTPAAKLNDETPDSGELNGTDIAKLRSVFPAPVIRMLFHLFHALVEKEQNTTV